jgi:hypothetical protein
MNPNTRHTFYDNAYFVVYTIQFVSDTRYFGINGMREFQDLCRRHQSLLLRQSVQLLQRVFDVLPPHKLLEEFF